MTSRVNGPDNFLVVVGFLFQYVHYHSNHLYTSLTTEAIALHFEQNCKDAVTPLKLKQDILRKAQPAFRIARQDAAFEGSWFNEFFVK